MASSSSPELEQLQQKLTRINRLIAKLEWKRARMKLRERQTQQSD